METRKVECDFCNRNLTECYEIETYSIILVNRQLPMNSMICLDLAVSPILDSNKDFCGIECLKKWLVDFLSVL